VEIKYYLLSVSILSQNLDRSTSRGTFLFKHLLGRSMSDMQLQKAAHLGCYNQHSCIAEAYKTRGRSFQGRQLRRLVTSKAGCNQASGSFLSAAAGTQQCCRVGGLSRLLTELMTKTLF